MFALLKAFCTLLPLLSGEPATGTSRSCVSGELCVVTGIVGTGLADGDFLSVLPLCGVGPVLLGMPGGFGESLPASSGGTHFVWPGVLLVDGGEYRLCWCSGVGVCSGLSYFNTDIGTMTVTGPISGLAVTCTSGQHCVVATIDGVYLQDGDSVMVLTVCAGLPINGFPNGAKTNTGALQGREHSWGDAKISAVGGDYALCWCAKGATCSEAADHRKQLGSIQVIGPSGTFSKVCGVHEDCTWSGITGIGLQDGDRIMILKVCGEGPIVPGFPNADIAIATGGGGSYSFGADNYIRAGGAEYAMCWCQTSNANVCTGPTNFLTPAGLLIVSGAASHDVSCVQGFECKLTNFTGVGLAEGDKIKILLECAVGSDVANWPNQGIAEATAGGQEYLTWQGVALTAQFGNYRICWCKLGWDCSSTAGFKMDAGALRVVGINPGQSRSCHAGAPCQITGLTGSNLRNGDLIKILTACGATGQEVLGVPNNATSLPSTSMGQSFSWGVTNLIEAVVGDYKMCWCPYGNSDGCTANAHFATEAGTLSIRGPVDVALNASCVAGQTPECVVGPFEAGVGLTYGSDRIALVSTANNCGTDAADTLAGGTSGKEVGTDKMLRFTPTDLPYGGTWKMCYCASFDSSLDQDALQCGSTEDFAATAGFLTVLGAFPDQTVNCTRNEACTFVLEGNGLNSAIHRLAITDSSGTCGASESIDTATRRRRDVTSNPYSAVGVTVESYLTFTVDPIQALDSYIMCFCIPAIGGSLCSATSLTTYRQNIGILDIRGATAGQQFTCGRGGRCTLDILGRGLSTLDRAKIVNTSTACTGEPQETGFFKSLLIADRDGTTSTSARFSLGQVTAGGTFKVCYCASLDACNSLETFNHQAGELDVVDPISQIEFSSATVASVTVKVQSVLEGTSSRVRCAASEYEPSYMPNGADIANGLTPIGLGQGEAPEDTKAGDNFVQIFFKTFVKAAQQYRVWCVEGSAQSYILPPTQAGTLVFTPSDLVHPRLQVHPSFLWPQASFYAELYNVFGAALGRRLQSLTEVRVQTSASPYMCNRMLYADAVDMVVSDTGTGQNDARLLSAQALEASSVRLYLCFFASPLATGIALVGDDRLTVQKQIPSFSIQRLDGLALQRFYRGVILKVILEFSSGEGLLHWTSEAHYATAACAGAARAGPDAQSLSSGSSGYFRNKDSVGFYHLCYLGVASEAAVGGTVAPMNSLGLFELSDVIHSVEAETNPSSTRNMLRLKLQVRMPGTVTCIARNDPGNVLAGDFSPGVLYEGRSSLLIPPVEEGVDPEFPREFSLELPLVEYQRQGNPMRVWCLHSLAEDAVFPANSDGISIPLQASEPSISSRPTFLWSSARFRLMLANTPAVAGKLLGLHTPALPFGWSRELAQEEGKQVLRYIDPNGVASSEHPRYLQWLEGQRVDLCLGANASKALKVDADLFTRTSDWFTADAESCFVCFWESASSFPHLLGKLEIRAQAPEHLLEVVGQFRPLVYRGSNLTLRLRYGSESGGRLLVLKKETYDSFGGNCQDLSLARRLEDEGDEELEEQQQAREWPSTRALQSVAGSGSGNCTSTPRKISDLKLIDAEALFPLSQWGEASVGGGNCTNDFKLYWSANLELTSILGDKSRQRYILVTSNSTVLELFVQKIRSLTLDGQLPQTNQVVVHKDFSDISQSIAQQFVASTADCSAQLLLQQASPMYEEGAETLPLSQYLQASLELQGFDFHAVAFLPNIATVIEKQVLCPVLQPPAAAPIREESIWDIDVVGVGRPLVNGAVFVPALMNGTSSFLHSEPLGEYVVCYAGDEDPAPIFNRIGPIFPSVDVLQNLHRADEPYQSTSLMVYVNITSQIPGLVRCLGFLDTKIPPQVPQDVFIPTDSQSFLGESDIVQYDVPGSHQVVALRLEQTRVAMLASAVNFVGASPSVFVWCAHDGSTLVYPSGSALVVDTQARAPPPFVYKQFNATITSVELTLNLEFSPIVAEFSEEFPKNYYDQVEFRARPALPAGLTIDASTGAIGGIPTFAGAFIRSLVAISANPPRSAASYELQIAVKDVLGPTFTSASADNMLISIQPRATNIFQPQKAFLLVRKRTTPFTDTPEEFFCLNALRDVPFRNVTQVTCSVQDEICCCASYILLHVPVQDLRLRSAECSFQPTERYHVGGLVEGLLRTSEGVARPARLHSSYKVYATMPPEVTAQDKKPIRFDLLVLMPFEEYQESLNTRLIQELTDAVFIPKDLVQILKVEPGETLSTGGTTLFTISFYVEPRCLQELGPEVELLSFGINTKDGCNLLAPVEYMTELKTQLSNRDSALFYQQDLVLLNKVHPERSFAFVEQHLCNREPFWEFGAVADSEGECPFDLVKLSTVGTVTLTLSLALLLGLLARAAHQCGCCLRLAKVRILDVLTPIMGLYTTGADYVWLFYLQGNNAHPLHTTLFMGCLCNLFLCFVVNAAVLRMMLTSYIIDTPWWRKNRKRLRLILLLSVLSPRFFRITNSHIGAIDRTHIHFGTPSKMAVVFAKLGLATLLQDIPLLLVQVYVWLVWRNLAPKVSLLCFGLGVQSILTTILHHVFSRSQRAAYERVVKLLGVRRLTAGFFDVSAGVGTQAGKGEGGLRVKKTADDPGSFMAEGVDPTKLDPIQAAMYVAQMYDKRPEPRQEEELSSQDSDDSKDVTGPTKTNTPGSKTLYPPGLYEKMHRFYSQHDPSKVASIAPGNVAVDEEALDVELKSKFGVGLDSVSGSL